MVEQSAKQLSVRSQGGAFKLVGDEAVPTPGAGQALIRVHYSTVNPYDRICHKAEAATEGFTLGCDGCGVVESVGDGVDSSWVGKKVAFLGGGWARYAVKDVDYLVQFADDFDLKQGANTYVNPFTVTAMLDIAQKRGAKAVILLAASSALAKQFIRLAQQHDITTISIVRKDEQVQDLKTNYGAVHVLNQTSPSFFAELDKTIEQTQPMVLYECVGGDLPGDVLTRMPRKAVMVVYGNLTHQRITFPAHTFHWLDQEIIGLVMFRWLSTQITAEERQKWFKLVANDLEQGGKVFGSKIVKTVNIAEWEKFIEESEGDATNGKYLVNLVDA